MRATLFSALLIVPMVVAPAAPEPVEHVTYRLHYVQKPIGYEHDTIARDGDARVLRSDFEFTDRGGRVPLAATLRTSADYTPIAFTSRGKTYRFVNVDSEVTVHGREATVRADGREEKVALPSAFFVSDGYAPFAAQMFLLRYWRAHGRPRHLRTVPGEPLNDVIVEERGIDDIAVGARHVRLRQYVIDGVVWGRETLWMDEAGSLAAAITRAGRPELRGRARGSRGRPRQLRPRGDARPDRRSRGHHQGGAPIRSAPTRSSEGRSSIATGRAPIADGAIVVRDGASPPSGRARPWRSPPA